MCMLCVVPPNVIPSREKLEASALNNPHGFGFAIVIPSEKRIHAERTMNADTSINRFLEMRGKYPEGYALWHARFATHGTTTVENCHPFQVCDSKTYLAHNGILSIVEPKGDTRSDTRIFAEDLLPAIGGVTALDNEQVWNLLEDFTSGSKVCVLTVDPRAEHQMYLLHEEKGKHDETGVWWSNDTCYLAPTRAWTSVSPHEMGLYATGYDYDYSEVMCEICNTVAVTEEIVDTKCATCGSCFDCFMYKTDCLCWQGRTYYDATTKSEGAWGF